MVQGSKQEQKIQLAHWSKSSANPNQSGSQAAVRRFLQEIELVQTDTDINGYVEKAAADKRMLDIGVASHTDFYWGERWPHRRFAKAASYHLGIDILAELVQKLADQGYNVRTADATSDIDLGERFDLIFAGDVIEHVNNAVALLSFAARHLKPDGRILVSTPNPFSRKFFRRFRREKRLIVNLDHVAWVTPTMALELAHRSQLELKNVHLIKPMSAWKAIAKTFAWRFEPVEYSFPDYLYEFAVPLSSAEPR